MGRDMLGDNDRNRRLRHESEVGEPTDDDRAETWSREQLRDMDQQFRRRLERAIRSGHETKPGASSR